MSISNNTSNLPSLEQGESSHSAESTGETLSRKLDIRIDVGSLVTIVYTDKPDQERILFFVDQEHLLSDLPETVQQELAGVALQLLRIDSPLGKVLKDKTVNDEAHIVVRRRRNIKILKIEDLT